ncbi:MAG: hypothetical protein PVF30_09460 [Desulfobacterales bacterium]
MLWFDLYRRTGFNRVPHYIHVSVAESNASIGPVESLNKKRKPPIAVFLAMDHNITTGVNTAFAGFFTVFCIGVRDVNRFVVCAARVFVIEDIATLRGAPVALFLFVSPGVRTK